MEKKKINEITLFANIQGENGREVREARITELNVRPCYLHFDHITHTLYKIEGCGFSFKIEIAGIGEMTINKFESDLHGRLYSNMDFALRNNHPIYSRNEWVGGSACLYLYFANIHIDDLNLNTDKATFERIYGKPNKHNDLVLKTISYSWTGTCTQKNEIHWKFRIDLINKCVTCYHDQDEDKLGKLYATREMCEQANKPTIITFDKPKKTTKLVTFEVTTRVVVDADGDDAAAIEEAINKFKRDEINGICFETCVEVRDDNECPYQE